MVDTALTLKVEASAFDVEEGTAYFPCDDKASRTSGTFPRLLAVCVIVLILVLACIISLGSLKPLEQHLPVMRQLSTVVEVQCERPVSEMTTASCKKANDRNGNQVWTGKTDIAFLHVGKAGGSSFEALMLQHLSGIDAIDRYIGYVHFDWSYLQGLRPSSAVNVVMWLREPVSRAMSHFQYAKSLPWAQDVPWRNLSLSDYIKDRKALDADPARRDDFDAKWTNIREAFADGLGGVSWLTGSWAKEHKWMYKWVKTNETHSLGEAQFGRDETKLRALAANRLQETFWFGLLEDQQRSLALLWSQLNDTPLYTQAPKHFQLPHVNTHENTKGGSTYKKHDLSQDEVAFLQSELANDVWLYSYAKKLFHQRWTARACIP